MLQDIQEAHAGQIVAVFGVDCATGLYFLWECARKIMLFGLFQDE